ncbi:MAG: glutaminyl-peptide cyclotransferase, partial [Thermoanaerobaculia bacterium]
MKSRRTMGRIFRVTIPILSALIVLVGHAAAQTPVCHYDIITTLDHDDEAFTQGLVFSDGVFFESTGLYGESSLRRVE